MERISISAIQIRDLNAIKSISDLCFGQNYLSINQLTKTLKNPGIYSKIEINSQLVGFCLAPVYRLNTDNSFFTSLSLEIKDSGMIKSLAIHPDFQRKGKGTLLLKHVIHKIKFLNKSQPIYFPSWMESTCDGFCKLIKLEGFKEVKIFSKYWSDDSLKNNYSCVKCGNPPCQCSMRLFKLV